MLLIAILQILNACLNNNLVNSSSLRLEVAHLPMNVFDIGSFIILAWSLLPSSDSFFRTDGVSKPLAWTLILCTVATVFGIIGAAVNPESMPRQVITDTRNFVMIPIAIISAYRCTKNLKSAYFYCYLLFVCGVITAIIIPLNFANASENLHTTQSITTVRIIQYVSNYAGLAGAIFVFCLGMQGKTPLPKWMCLILAGFCCVGQCATLSRSDWAAVAAGLIAALAVMPLYSWRQKVLTTLVALPVVFAFVCGAIFAAEKISGREMFKKMADRVISMLPGEHEGIVNASATRLTGTFKELEYWSQSPLWGKGFAVQDSASLNEWEASAAGFRHDTWTSTLAETGLIGFAAMGMMCAGQMVVGWGMVRRRLDRRTVLVGAAGVVTGAHFIAHGFCTMSFNILRDAIPVAMTCGVVFRTRAIEQTMLNMYQGYLPDESEANPALPLLEDAGPPAFVHAPADAWASGGTREADFVAH